jgi:hypothetical protein
MNNNEDLFCKYVFFTDNPKILSDKSYLNLYTTKIHNSILSGTEDFVVKDNTFIFLNGITVRFCLDNIIITDTINNNEQNYEYTTPSDIANLIKQINNKCVLNVPEMKENIAYLNRNVLEYALEGYGYEFKFRPSDSIDVIFYLITSDKTDTFEVSFAKEYWCPLNMKLVNKPCNKY